MEGLDNRLIKMSKVTDLMNNSMTFTGETIMTRKSFAGSEECLIKWSPPDMLVNLTFYVKQNNNYDSSSSISDEWVPKKSPAQTFTKTVKLKSLKPEEKAAAELLIESTYRRNIQIPKEPPCLDILTEIVTPPAPLTTQPIASNAPLDDASISVKVSGSKRRKMYHGRIATSS